MEKDRLKQQIARHYEQSKQLQGEYAAAYSQMVVYVRTAAISEKDMEEIVNDILLILLEAQERGASAGDVLGEDLQAFCNQMIELFKTAGLKSWMKNNGYMLLPSLNIGIFFSWLIGFDLKSVANPEALLRFNLSLAFIVGLIGMAACSLLLFWWIHVDAFRKSSLASNLIGGAIFTAAGFAVAWIYRITEHLILVRFSSLWVVAFMIGIVALGMALSRNGSTVRA